jgi:L-fucose isomerase-like protein
MLNLGFLTTASGRWPKELPQKRRMEYGAYLKSELPSVKIVAFQDIADTPQKVGDAIDYFRAERADSIVMVYGAFTGDDVCTRLAEELRVPVILWAPYEPPFDGGRLLANALVAMTMNSAAMKRLGYPCHIIYGSMDDPRAAAELQNLVKAHGAVKKMKGSLLGLLGYRPTAFYNSTFNEALIRRTFGVRMEETDLCVVLDAMNELDEAQVREDMEAAYQQFAVKDLPDGYLENHSRLRLALKRVMEEQGYDYAVLKCWPEMGARRFTPCAAMGRLADEGIHIGCEGDVDATLAMMLQNALTGKPCFITDMINIDEKENTLTFWHCGNPAPSLFKDKIAMRNHPLAGQGAALHGALKPGRVTVARLCDIGGQYRLFLLRGEAGHTEVNTGGAMVNVRIKMPVRDFVYRIADEQIPHHYSIVWDDVADDMIRAAGLLGIQVLEF